MQLCGYAVITLVITGYAIILLCADSALELAFFSAGRERRLETKSIYYSTEAQKSETYWLYIIKKASLNEKNAAKTFCAGTSRHPMTSTVRVYYNNTQLSTKENTE